MRSHVRLKLYKLACFLSAQQKTTMKKLLLPVFIFFSSLAFAQYPAIPFLQDSLNYGSNEYIQVALEENEARLVNATVYHSEGQNKIYYKDSGLPIVFRNHINLINFMYAHGYEYLEYLNTGARYFHLIIFRKRKPIVPLSTP